MTRGVDNIDFQGAIMYGGILGEDGNSPFPFQIVAVHHPVNDFFVGPKGACLPKQAIDESGFTMVNMGDDCYIPNELLFNSHLKHLSFYCFVLNPR